MPTNVTILTATSPSDLDSRHPVEEPHLWPTSANIVSSLKTILAMAKPKDLVYIHFSGHGTKILGHTSSGPHASRALSLVLFEDNEPGESYLRGHHLAGVLQRMVDKGLIVTLVLDCCFSGSVVRQGNWKGFQSRGVDYNPHVDAVSPQWPTDFFNSISTTRNAKMEKDWLIDPNGYTILSACGPYETAYEVEVDGEGKRGALTCLLFQALRTLNKSTEITYRSIHERLCTQFHASWPQQTPMFYGNRNLTILGLHATAPDDRLISICTADDGRLRLRAGQVHGICKDDEFAVCPSDSSESTTAGRAEILKVETARSFESDLVAVSPTFAISQIAIDSKVRRTTCAPPRKIRARLLPSVGHPGRWKEVAEGLPFLQLSTDDEGEPCLFNVAVNKHHEYEIGDTTNRKILGLPTITANSPEATSVVLDVLHHLATFKYLEGLENRLPNATFQRSFVLESNSAIGTSGVSNVKHRGIWSCTIENTSDRPLYLAIFNFNPSWEIVNLVSNSGGDDYVVIPPKGEAHDKWPIEMRMEVPESLRSIGKVQCEDIVKVFVTSRPTSFPLMTLPKISLDTNSLCHRVHNVDNLSRCFAELTASLRGQDTGMGDWVTQNFIVRTTLD
jgi:Caspase domain